MISSNHEEKKKEKKDLKVKEKKKDEKDLKVEEEEKHALIKVMDSFVHNILDIKQCAQTFIPLAEKEFNENIKDVEDQVVSAVKIAMEDEDRAKIVSTIKQLREVDRRLDRLSNSNVADTLEKSLFVNLFSTFDQFTGDLISILYQKEPELFKSINREIKLSEALKYKDLNELRQVVLDKEIENLRRDSYTDQFRSMEKMFNISLTKFDSWSKFIENSQRRNLFTHCDGVVSEQYLQICKTVGFKTPKEISVGDQLEIGTEYFFQACERIMEVALMLGQTLWRKLFPEELMVIDTHLQDLIFDFLHREHWESAINLSKFALELPKISSEDMKRVYTINYAIALRGIGEEQASINVLNKEDWSASTYDFKLAYSILTDNFSDAKKFMLRIGKTGEKIIELSYHDWPLFRDFKTSKEFLSAYKTIYGHQFLERAIEKTSGKKKKSKKSKKSKKKI